MNNMLCLMVRKGRDYFHMLIPARSSTMIRMQDPRCVLQILKRHYARYTPEVVEQICGVPQDIFLKIADTLVKTLDVNVQPISHMRLAGRNMKLACR